MNVKNDQLLERASLLLAQGRSKDAEHFIRQVLENNPEDDHALSLLTRAFYGQKKTDEGIETILRAIRVEPEKSYYFYLLAFCYYQKHIRFAAIENLHTAIKLNPFNAEYSGLLAFIFIEEKDYEQALSKADEGLSADPENSTCLNARARALNKLKRTSEAVETIENSLSKEPDNEMTHATMGWNYLEIGQHKKANRHFREALRINPDYGSARIGLKESLKSNFLPYKWIMLFGLWLSEKGKNFQWGFTVALLIIINILRSIATENSATRIFIVPVIALYFIFVAFSWIANPVANFFLLFHRDGRYSVTKNERIVSIAVVTAMGMGFSLIISSFLTTGNQSETLLFSGIVGATLVIPFGLMQFPIDFKSRSLRTWYPPGLVATGLLSILLLWVNNEAGTFFVLVYIVALFIFQWVANAWVIGK
jgi:tetratricopeptide (TPR) repeat protein